MKKNETTGFTYKLLADSIHKLKNGLGGINGFATLLERDLTPDDPHHRMVRKIQESVEKVNLVATSLMLAVNEPELDIDEMHLFSLIKQVWGNFQVTDAETETNIVVQPSISSPEFTIKGDNQQIERMIEHVYIFVGSIEGAMKTISLSEKDANSILIEFIYLPHEKDENESLTMYLSDLHEVLPRLSLTIIDKLCMLHDGKMSLTTENGLKKITIQLPKGSS